MQRGRPIHNLSLLWSHPRILTAPLDIDSFTLPQPWICWLRYSNQYTTRGANNDLLTRFGGIVFLLHLVTRHSTPDSAEYHRDITACAATDQTAKTKTRKSAGNGTDTLMVIALDLNILNLFDYTAANVHFTWLATSH
jgi:hypothetical protein